MKELPIRKFTTVVGYLTEAVIITKDGQPIGTFTPAIDWPDGPAYDINATKIKEASVEEPVKKSLEIDKARPDTKGQIRKGLGPLPGEDPTKEEYQRTFRPVPKPGKK